MKSAGTSASISGAARGKDQGSCWGVGEALAAVQFEQVEHFGQIEHSIENAADLFTVEPIVSHCYSVDGGQWMS